LRDVDPQGRAVWLTASIRLDRSSSGPAAVFISAYASSAVYWDGKLIGMNGVPSQRPELERSGLRDASFQIPDATRGDHQIALHMSSHHGVVRLRSPVTQVSVAPFERPSSIKMRDYLPALMSAGGLLMMVLIFAFLSWSRQHRAGSLYLLGAALCTTGQLGAEASRAFLEYPYPVHFLRLALVLAFALGLGFLLLGYLVRRYRVAQLGPIMLAHALGASLAILLVPSFDQKTGLVLTSAMTIGMLLAIRATTRWDRGALPVALMLAVGLIFSLAEPHTFLDRDLYLWAAALFALLLADEAGRFQSAVLPARPAAAASGGGSIPPPGIWLGTGTARRFLLQADIVRLAAADDYTELFLAAGGSVLHPEPLEKLLERLSPGFHRVHRSHAINLSHLRSFRKGQSSSVLLSDQSVAPVSRRRVAALQAVIGG
jgi:hypothetical protein